MEVVPPDPGWVDDYERVRAQVLGALGARALSVEHVGSTAVPGLWAKPVIDVDVTVADSGDEASYLPDLEAAGFVLTVREPEWHQHRCLRGPAPVANVHVWSPGSVEPQRTRRSGTGCSSTRTTERRTASSRPGSPTRASPT